MMKSIVVAALCIASVPLRAEPELKGTAEELTHYLAHVPRLVTMVGEAELKVPADRALISLKVVTENRALQEASRANQEARARILRGLAEHGVPAERVQPSKFSSTPRYGVFSEKAKSYRVENTVKITVNDEREFQTVAALVDSMPEIRYECIDFEHSDKDAMRAKALSRAIDKAGEKRKVYEDRLGVKLTAKGFTENPLPPVSVASRGYGNKMIYAKSASASLAPMPAAGDIETEEVPASFGELVFKAQITVEYALENR